MASPSPWLQRGLLPCLLAVAACGDGSGSDRQDTSIPAGWIYDGDGDGYGAEVDCDDDDAAINPSTSPELAPADCDGVDNDCDGEVDEGCGEDTATEDNAVSDVAAATLEGTALSYVGWAAAVGDLTGDGRADVAVGGPGESSSESEAGVVWLVAGPISGAVSLEEQLTLSGESERDRAGWSVEIDDLDGDGVADLVTGAPYYDSSGTDRGQVYVIHGPITSSGSLRSPAVRLIGEDDNQLFGESLALGDWTGDGLGDVAVGAPSDATVEYGAGLVSVIPGPIETTGQHSSLGVVLYGSASFESAGAALADGGDMDGDGLSELLVGSPHRTDSGTVFVLPGPVIAGGSLEELGEAHTGESGAQLGDALTGGHDVNGDGYDDALLGAWGLDDAGSSAGGAYFLAGGAAPGALDDAPRLLGEASFDYAGSWVESAGDIDGDGTAELLIAAPGRDEGGTASGAAYAISGPISGAVSLSEASVRLLGAAQDQLSLIRRAADTDGDGADELLLGAWHHGDGGALWLVP